MLVLVLTVAGEPFSAGIDLKLFFLLWTITHQKKHALARQIVLGAGKSSPHFPNPPLPWLKDIVLGPFTPLVACNIAIAAEEASFGLSEENWGILPGGLVSKVVTMSMNYHQSLYFAMTGKSFNGKKLQKLGW